MILRIQNPSLVLITLTTNSPHTEIHLAGTDYEHHNSGVLMRMKYTGIRPQTASAVASCSSQQLLISTLSACRDSGILLTRTTLPSLFHLLTRQTSSQDKINSSKLNRIKPAVVALLKVKRKDWASMPKHRRNKSAWRRLSKTQC